MLLWYLLWFLYWMCSCCVVWLLCCGFRVILSGSLFSLMVCVSKFSRVWRCFVRIWCGLRCCGSR